jgi:hypothetical protein
MPAVSLLGHGHSQRNSPLRLGVGAGIDAGLITVARPIGTWGSDAEQLVGSCVSVASKLSGRVRPPNSIGITTRSLQHGQPPARVPQLIRVLGDGWG